MLRNSASLFERLGGRPTLEKVHKVFYDKVYADPWLRQFFDHVGQEHIENQQTDFMARCFGGPKLYFGRPPNTAHEHIFINQEMIDRRHGMLRDAIDECGVRPDLAKEWVGVDNRFTRAVLKGTIKDCVKRYRTDNILAFTAP